MSTQRSNAASRLRSRLGPLIYDCSETDFSSPERRKEKFRNMIGWSENSKGQWMYSQWRVEVLHRDYDGKRNVKTIFLNPKLMKVLSGIIRGANSVVAMSQDLPSTSGKNTETLDVIWGLDHTTPGMIAAAAVLTRWVASPDNCLKEHGSESGIRWIDDFEDYLDYLIKGLRERKSSVLNIFKEWDRVLFPNAANGLGGRQATPDRDEETREMMGALDKDSEPEGEGGDNDAGNVGPESEDD
ncbi:hypothetical protein HYDPIDRAFT_171095 [Hydnomerulius pinastri MD-312]|uniref:Uncharacterized protein n=1 Tax=Hydnomerulius pinastri MD-312 TaxID=994086 RepID=A0A0C9VME5_9AGAM|nr:hypothetical protein HYDPIDRAFT_171095 [Hydnomerulius pinastri MD-312]